ncbi:MAG: ABC transporter permease subunit [Deltaproteobacteria bacterium]|nr:ABC transporter permease subunit [Deltaproteobacteria bacterium]
MHGIFTIYRKEMEDHFSSVRFLLIAALIVMVGVIIASMVGMSMQEEIKGVAKPDFIFLLLFTSTGKLFSFTQFIGLLGPLIGIILGFDAVNRERTGRTLSKLVSQPIYRDAIINGKFLAGVTMITIVMTSIVLIIAGLGIRLVGVVPGANELWRLAIYLVVSIVYISFWMGAAILFSVVFRSTATSALASLAAWILLSFFVGLGGSFLADAVAPVSETADMAQAAESFMKNERIQRVVSLVSPMTLYGDATSTILDPLRKTPRSFVLMGPMERLSLSRFQNPLPLLQSVVIVAPYLISLLAITCVCFGICYWVFMRQEIRST